MSKVHTILTLFIVALFAGGALGISIWSEMHLLESPAASAAKSNPEALYSLATIAEHADATSCWTTIEGLVYDVTNWIGKHPGGSQSILATCGTDGTKLFLLMPDAVMPMARATMTQFLIGTLSE